MKKTEIEFLRAAGYSIEEIMAMYPEPAAQPATPDPTQSAQPATPDPTPATPGPTQTAQPATPDPAQTPQPATPSQTPAPSDQSAVILAKLDSLIAAIQAGNRAASNATPPVKQSAEEIAAQLI